MTPKRILLINAPMSDLFASYPGAYFLAGHLRNLGYEVIVEDLSLKFGLKVFSADGLKQISKALKEKFESSSLPPRVDHFLKHEADYINTIDAAIGHLQGRYQDLDYRIANRGFYPPSPNETDNWTLEKKVESRINWTSGDPLHTIFGRFDFRDKSRYLSSLFLRDIVSIINEGLDSSFGIASYGGLRSEDKVWRARVERDDELLPAFMDELARSSIEKYQPDVVGISAPYNHTAFGAMRVARAIKSKFNVPIVLGGHFPTTCLRNLSDPWYFKYSDFIVLDNGERSLELILDHLAGRKSESELLRTYFLKNGNVQYVKGTASDVKQAGEGIPSFLGVKREDYPSVVYSMSTLRGAFLFAYSNKVKLSNGCYWGKCTFCETKLDYVGNYYSLSARTVLDQIKRLIDETDCRVFHFVDEAMPPGILRKLCEMIIEEGVQISWYGYVRLDKEFTPDLTRLMQRAGCVYVQAGVETPNDRLLGLMKKGLTLSLIAQISRNFTDAKILVEVCLMFGFPTQTPQEIVDGLDYIRQLFLNKCIQGATWGQFYFTPHAPVSDEASSLGLEVDLSQRSFERWDFPIRHKEVSDYSIYSEGLNRAVENFIHARGLDRPAEEWFDDLPVPKPSLASDFVARALMVSSTNVSESVGLGNSRP